MKLLKISVVFLSVLCFFISSTFAYAQIKALGIGEAIIENNNMNTAYKAALNNALLDSIKEYYENISDNTTSIPDITPEYLKFIKSYRITSNTVEDYKINIGVETSLDTLSLNDVGKFINQHIDTSVFLFKSIPDIISDREITAIINKTLQNNNFSTMDQNNFTYLITDINDTAQIVNAFASVNGRYMFQFDFNVNYLNPTDTDNTTRCEITTTTDIKIKHGEEKTLKITTNSPNANKRQCVSDALTQAVVNTIDYVRNNIIKEKPESTEIYSYEIKIINFKNMVSTNRFISHLAQKGFINKYKAAAFASKEIIFNVESIFSAENLIKKINEAAMITDITIEENSRGLVVNFNPVYE